MGVHGLWELLAPVGRRVSVELLGNKKLAVDASIWIVQFLKAMRDDRGEVVRNAHLLGFFRRICKLIYLRVKPVFVFDGGTPQLKRRTVIARRRQREQAQSKIRKTAEKLLLNHLKAKKLEELVREEGQAQAEQSATADAAKVDQENSDGLLAASLAKEWEEEATAEEKFEEEEQILPVVQGKVDPAVLAALPPSMQLKLLDEMKEHLVAENRQKFERVAKAPASFSKLQIEAYLKTVAFRRDINEVQKAAANLHKGSVPSVRIASEANREYILSSEIPAETDVREERNAPRTRDIPQVLEEAAEEVPEFFKAKSKGRKRFSRIRGMGVRMTRDLQWNLYLMKDKEARDAEMVANAGEDADAAFEKLVSEGKAIDEDDDAGPEWEESNHAADVEKGDIEASLACEGKNIDEDDDAEPEWEESNHAADAAKGKMEVSFLDDGSLEDDKDFAKLIADSNEVVEEQGIQVSFLDDGLLDADETFEKMVSESQPEEIEWENEEENHEKTENNGDEIEWEEEEGTGDKFEVVEIKQVEPEEIQMVEKAVEINEVEAGDEKPEEEVTDPARIPGTGEVTVVDVTMVEDELPRDVTMVEDELPGETTVVEDKLPGDNQVTSTGDVTELPGKATMIEPGKVGDNELFSENGEKEEFLWEDEPAERVGPEVERSKVMNGVSEEQAEIEEAIRRSLMDFQVSKSSKPLVILEPGAEYEAQSEKPPGEDERLRKGEDERLRKGKGLLYPEGERFPGNEAMSGDAREKASNGETRRRDVTDAEEEFLRAEDAAARRAFIEEEREKLSREEAELLAEQKKNERNAESVTNEMFAECQELLQMFGVPYVIAPMEAEAQCAFMDSASLVDGVITDDSDVFLFGGRSVYKNIFDGHKYVETYYMKDAESDLGLNQEKLIRMAMLLGSDYTEGISGIGIVNAIEVVNAFPEEDGLEKLKEWIESPDLMLLDKLQPRKSKSSKKKQERDEAQETEQHEQPAEGEAAEIDDKKRVFMRKHRAVSKNWTVPPSFPSKAVHEAYTSPQIDKSAEIFSWGRPDLELLRKFCSEKFGWSYEKADELLLPALKEYDRRETQLRLDAFYSFNQRFAKIRSSRIQKAVSGITGQTLPEMIYGDSVDVKKKKPRKQKSVKKEAGASVARSKRKTRNPSSKGDEAQGNSEEKKKTRKNPPRKRRKTSEPEEEAEPQPQPEAQDPPAPGAREFSNGAREFSSGIQQEFSTAGETRAMSGGDDAGETRGAGGFVVDDEENLREIEAAEESLVHRSDGAGEEAVKIFPDSTPQRISDPSLRAIPFFRRKRKST